MKNTAKRVIVLIDEYDKPILDHLDDHEMAEKIRNVLRTFYSTLKSSDAYLDFVFITGITKFTKVGVFSTLNNLNDISIWDVVSQMLGYNQEELESDFDGVLEKCQNSLEMNRQELFDEIKQYYNGFSSNGKHFVYNPFSNLNFLNKHTFDNYWVESGSPQEKEAGKLDLDADIRDNVLLEWFLTNSFSLMETNTNNYFYKLSNGSSAFFFLRNFAYMI